MPASDSYIMWLIIGVLFVFDWQAAIFYAVALPYVQGLGEAGGWFPFWAFTYLFRFFYSQYMRRLG